MAKERGRNGDISGETHAGDLNAKRTKRHRWSMRIEKRRERTENREAG